MGDPAILNNITIMKACTAVYKNIRLPPLFPSSHTQYIFDCSQVSSLPTMAFTIGGKDFKLTGSEYVLDVSPK